MYWRDTSPIESILIRATQWQFKYGLAGPSIAYLRCNSALSCVWEGLAQIDSSNCLSKSIANCTLCITWRGTLQPRGEIKKTSRLIYIDFSSTPSVDIRDIYSLKRKRDSFFFVLFDINVAAAWRQQRQWWRVAKGAQPESAPVHYKDPGRWHSDASRILLIIIIYKKRMKKKKFIYNGK